MMLELILHILRLGKDSMYNMLYNVLYNESTTNRKSAVNAVQVVAYNTRPQNRMPTMACQDIVHCVQLVVRLVVQQFTTNRSSGVWASGASIPMGQGGHVPPIFGLGGHYHECPPQYF